jgi:pantoate--beta-alanine ligase
MHIFREIVPARAYLKHERSRNSSVGLVPTMGALHPGHLSLVEASKRENTITVCSVFLNPTQFNNPVDLANYPRTLDNDLRLLLEAGCDAVFCPSNDEMYDAASSITFDVGPVGEILEGEFRPGHFSGVVLVVSKLFNIVEPDRAYFGQKDFQQFTIIDRLVKDLRYGVSLVCAPIVREADGLAMSSRNMRLNAAERKRAATLYQCLLQTRKRLLAGEPFEQIRTEMKDFCARQSVMLEYLAIADREDLTLLNDVSGLHHKLLLIAARVGDIRLIDNLFLSE